ncbi:uncharacterized protein C7orf26-like [Asterias rubens]|uniref:uncharacterized protein C7orf26-like n=1 Tax=Asterias rubens TaxID=7604 RepID=UPI001455D50E|nr:uncharacterized protein C7orf26-like [Asterias rubens]
METNNNQCSYFADPSEYSTIGGALAIRQEMASYTIGPEDVCLWYSDTHLRLPELRKTLQRQDFPRATRTLLEWIHRYFVQCENFPPGKFPNQECVRQLIAEFVFYRNSGTSRVQQKLSAIQELRLLEELCNHFQISKNLITRHNVFDAFFGCKAGPVQIGDEHRTGALSKLVSMAVAVNCIPVLDCAAVLIHNQGASEATLALTQSIVQDFCILIPDAKTLLKDLVDSSPLFVSRLMACLAALYDVDRDPKKKNLPPVSLLEVIASWINKRPLIFIEHLLNPPPGIPSFHSGGQDQGSSRLQGPFPGLIKACVTSPLVLNRPISKTDVTTHREEQSTEHHLYSKLHLGILQALLATQNRQKQRSSLPSKVKLDELVSVRDMEGAINSLQKMLNGGHVVDEEVIRISLDRLAQVVQVAMSTGALACSKSTLKTAFDGLPNNQLLSLVLDHEGAIPS